MHTTEMNSGISILVGSIVAAGGIAWLLWTVPKAQINRLQGGLGLPDRIDQETKARAVLAQIVGGLVLLCGVFFTWKSYDLSRTGQLSDRFSKAAQLLDSKNAIPARIGAIAELRQIATESEAFRWPIMELLAAYVRLESPWPSDPKFLRCKQRAAEQMREQGEAHAREDIQAALDVLKLQDWHRSPRVLNLKNADLRGADLSDGNFFHATFNQSYLGAAEMSDSDLENVHMVYVCILEYTQCANSVTTGANAAGALLSGLKGCTVQQ